jgi:hypothetical protein
MTYENLQVRLKVVKTLKPATVLLVFSGQVFQIADAVFSSWPDLTNQTINHLDLEYFTDCSSFVQYATHFAGYAVVTLDAVIEA